MAERWLSTKANRAPKTVAGYRSLHGHGGPDQVERCSAARSSSSTICRYGSPACRSTAPVRFEGKGLSASRVRQAHQLVGAVLKFAVKARHLPANPADGVDLPRLPGSLSSATSPTSSCTASQWHRAGCAPSSWCWATAVCGSARPPPLRVADVDIKARRIPVRRSVTYVRKTGLVEGEPKNHSSSYGAGPPISRKASRDRGGRQRQAQHSYSPQRATAAI